MLAGILKDIGASTKRPGDLADVLPAVEALAMYVVGRMTAIVTECGTPPDITRTE